MSKRVSKSERIDVREGAKHSAQAKARIAKGTAYGMRVAREKRRMRQPVLDVYVRDGVVSEPLRPLVKRAQNELGGWLQARGGVDVVSELERSVLDDAATLGVVRDALLALFLESRDPELATKISTLTAARRASLQAVGLQRRERDLDDYLAAMRDANATQAARSRDFAAEDVSEVGSEDDRPAERSSRGKPPQEEQE